MHLAIAGITLLTVFKPSYAILGQCRVALGMEAGQIPDSAISASSSYETKSVGPQNARIRQEKNGGAWCPKAQISSEVREYLEIDLMRNHLITQTETQGRFGNGQGQEYAEAFRIEYWRLALRQWILYRDSERRQLLKGNRNTYLAEPQLLELPFIASKVRFIPFSEHPRTVCMRVEIYGCPWSQHVIQYSMPLAGVEDPRFTDVSYDGIVESGKMFGGLGQLVDGLLETDLEEFSPHKESSNRWVGWSNESLNGKPLEIIFEFDEPREFSFVHIHVNNMFRQGSAGFSLAIVGFSLDGIKYHPSPSTFSIPLDKSDELARNISMPLKNRIGRFVRLKLYLAGSWLLLSEITFDSGKIIGNMTEEGLEQYLLQQDSGQEPILSQKAGNAKRNDSVGLTTHARKESTPGPSPSSNAQTYIGLAAGVLGVLVLFLGCTVFLMIRRGRKKVALLHKHTALVSSSTKPGVTINMKDLPVIHNGLARSRVSVKVTSNGKARGVEPESDSETSSVYHEPYKLLPSIKNEYGCLIKRDGLSSSKSGDYTDFTSVNSFQEEVKFSSSVYNLGPLPRPPPYEATTTTYQTPTKTAVPSESFYAATDILKSERREQHFTPGRVTPIKLPTGPAPESATPPPEFPRHRFRIVDTLGEGSFGMVHVCEAEGSLEHNGVSTFHKKQLVLVKSLWRGASDSTKQDFVRECTWLCALKDHNLCRIIGVCTQDEPLSLVQEYSEQGELAVFLKQRSNIGEDPISYGSLIYMATQVASGMKYLESKEFVHRDLAARNCIVGKNLSVKISDHAMYSSRFDADYYKVDTKARLPIRWMAWESLLLGKQTSKSDIWSFAVTLWEMLVHCNQQPFAELTNEQVVENSNHWYQNDGLARYLPRPANCPREIYDLMGECWRRHAADRPRFQEIHLFLQRKNLGFIPA